MVQKFFKNVFSHLRPHMGLQLDRRRFLAMQQLVEQQSPKEPLREETPRPALDREGRLIFKSLKMWKFKHNISVLSIENRAP